MAESWPGLLFAVVLTPGSEWRGKGTAGRFPRLELREYTAFEASNRLIAVNHLSLPFYA